MAVTRVQSGRWASTATLRSNRQQIGAPWVRPLDWLSLPDVTGGQKFAGLHRIDQDSNFVALTAAGDYTVDWGDGTTTDHATGTTAYKQYSYSAISSVGESTLGYRQVIIQVYPQSGQNLTSLSLPVRHNQSGISTYTPGWLDVAVNSASLTALSISSSSVPLLYLQQAAVLQNAIISMAGLFHSCRQLQAVALPFTATVTNMSSMFSGCYALSAVPLFNTAAVINMSSMFASCYSITTVPLFDTTAVTAMSSMFNTALALTAVPLFNTAAVTSTANMFNSCHALTTVPLFNTAAVVDMSNMFSSCYSLTTVPLFNTAAVTNMTSMFSSCYSLTAVPLFNTAAVTNMTSMFSTCYSLTAVPLFNTAAVTNMTSMFSNCFSLTTVPLFNTAAVTNMTSMFAYCYALAFVPLFNTAAVTNMTSMFYSCTALAAAPPLPVPAATIMSSIFQLCSALSTGVLVGTNRSISYANCKLSADALNAIYTNLSNTGTGKTITVTGNWGAATSSFSIAQDKGWTVTG